MFEYYDYKRSNFNFKGDFLLYSIFQYYFVILCFKKYQML